MQPVWQAAEQLTGTPRANIPLAFGFTTQTLFQALPAARATAVNDNNGLVNFFGNPPAPQNIPLAGTGGLQTVDQFFTANGLGALNGQNNQIDRIFAGIVNGRNYITDPLNGPWPEPLGNGTVRPIPFLLCVPAGAGPFPTVIFQHGLTRNKGDVLATANAYNANGFAIIAIDLELHGDLQTIPNANSGDEFINLVNLRMTRDNIRQSCVNLYYLTQAIMSNQSVLDGGTPLLASNPPPFYVGTSFGAIVGGTFTATETNVVRAVLNVGGGRLIQLILDSQSISPGVLAGLAQAGVQPGTADFLNFILIAQTVVDDADPFSYAAAGLSGSLTNNIGTNILIQEVLGDTVVPNSATEDLARSYATAAVNPPFTQVGAIAAIAGLPQAAAPFNGSGLWQIANAAHGAYLDPAQGPTQAIVGQILNFLGTGQIANTGFPRIENVEYMIPDPSDYDGVVYFGE